MNIYSLNDEKLEVIDFLRNENSIAIVNSLNPAEALNLVESFILKKLIEGKTFTIITKNGNEARSIAANLAKRGIADYCLDLQDQMIDNESLLATNVIADLDYQKESVKSSILYRKRLEKLEALTNKYNKPIFGEYPRAKIAELLYLAGTKLSPTHLDLDLSSKKFQFNKKEFWYLRGRVEKAAQFYKSDFTYLKNSDDLFPDLYKDFHIAKNQKVVFNYFKKFVADMEAILARYKAFFRSRREEMVTQSTRLTQQISALIDDLDLHLSFYEIELELSPPKKAFTRQKDHLEEHKQELRAKYEHLLVTLKDLDLFKVQAPPNSWIPDVAAIKDFYTKLRQHIDNSHQLIQTKVEEQLEILNQNNFQSQEIAEIIAEQEQLITTINATKLFKEEFQNLSISAWNNYDYLRSLHSRLLKNLQFLQENKAYGIWRSFEFSLESKALDLINVLESSEQTLWVDKFELWYFKSIFDKYPFESISEIREQQKLLEDSKFIYEDFYSFKVQNIFENKFFSADKKHQSSWNNKIKNLLKRGHASVQWKELQNEFPKLFRHRFPILISVEGSIISQQLIEFASDYLITIDNHNIQAELFGNSHFDAMMICQSKAMDPKIKDHIKSAKNYAFKQSFKLKQRTLPEYSKSSEQFTPNLKLSKAFASILKVLSFEKKFYSAKNFSIISCLSNFNTRLLEMELLEAKIKTLKYTHIDTGIVEDIMLKEDEFKILLVQEGFLDPKLNIEWQISVLRQLERMGIKIVHISTFELATQEKSSILDFLKHLDLFPTVTRELASGKVK